LDPKRRPVPEGHSATVVKRSGGVEQSFATEAAQIVQRGARLAEAARQEARENVHALEFAMNSREDLGAIDSPPFGCRGVGIAPRITLRLRVRSGQRRGFILHGGDGLVCGAARDAGNAPQFLGGAAVQLVDVRGDPAARPVVVAGARAPIRDGARHDGRHPSS
jgi:hypothetical protein